MTLHNQEMEGAGFYRSIVCGAILTAGRLPFTKAEDTGRFGHITLLNIVWKQPLLCLFYNDQRPIELV